jgi:hypothetical protein
MLADVDSLRVDVAGLQVLAARCEALAGEVGAASAGAPDAPLGQATGAAVAAVHASVTAAGTAMATRLGTTGTTLTAAATHFAEQETRSTSNIAAVPPSAAL